MKIAAELKLKHGILWELSRKYGTVKELAGVIGVGYQLLNKWLHMRGCPTPGKHTPWYTEEVEKKLEELAGVPAAEIFPPQLKAATSYFQKERVHVTVAEVEPAQLMFLAQSASERLTVQSPQDSAIASELKTKIASVLKTLSYREREILNLRYGLEDGVSMSLEEVANIFKVTRERIRQLEAKAMRKIQQPSQACELVDFLPESPPDFEAIDKNLKRKLAMSLKQKVYGDK